ncbi:MAG: D-alanyl-D-alanine carboxypeptidase, partial [Planctomycetaceae bacterium]
SVIRVTGKQFEKMTKNRTMKKFKCDLCLMDFPQVKKLQLHKKTEHEGTNCKCDQCGERFNVAENLIRHVALAKGLPTTAEGSAAAVAAELKRLKIPMRRVSIVDGSGLSRRNQMTAKAATAINRAMMDPARPELALGIFSMPRAGVNGTLGSRFSSSLSRCARDKVMAKTGTLRGVVSLSGVVGAKDGRPRAFTIFVNNYRGSTTSARYWTDAMATAVMGCR